MQLLLLLFLLLLLLLLLLDIVVMACITVELRASGPPVLIETFAARSVPRVGLVNGEWVHLRVLRALVPIRERVLLDVARVGVRALLSQVELAVHIEVVHLLQGHASALLSFL